MSVLALGAIFLIGGVMAITTSLIAAASGTALILQQNNSSLPKTIPQNIHDINKQSQELKESLENLYKTINQTITHKEMQSYKENLLKSVQEANSLFAQKNYYSLQEKINEIVKNFNEALVSSQLLTYQKDEILEEIKKLQSKVNQEQDIQQIQMFTSNPHNFTLQEIEKFYSYLEKKYYVSDLKIAIKSRKEELIYRIQNLISKIEDTDQNYWKTIEYKYQDLQNFDENYLSLLLEQASLDLSRIKTQKIRKNLYTSQLKYYLEILNTYKNTYENDEEFKLTSYYPSLLKLTQTIGDLTKEEYIEKKNFEDIQTKVLHFLSDLQKYIENRYLKESIKKYLHDALLKIGYTSIDTKLMEDLSKGEIVYLDLPYHEDYKVQVKLTKDNKIYFRLVKFAESLEPSEYEKQKDLEIARKWCQNYDEILKLLEQNGIIIENLQRLEPEQTEIAYILKEERKTQQQEQKYLQLE